MDASGGAELGRFAGDAVSVPFVDCCISPLAPASLLVNEDTAQPAHDAPLAGVLILGAPPVADS